MLGTCISIFGARVVDVSLGTLRTVYTVKGKGLLSSFIAFFEVLIWFIVAREALNTEVTSLLIPISYSLGYATGTLIGTLISKYFVSGLICLQVIIKKGNQKLKNAIRKEGYGISVVSLKDEVDDIKKELLLILVSKKKAKQLTSLIKYHEEDAFVMASEAKFAQNGLIK